MSNPAEEIHVRFHDRARSTYFALLHDFDQSAGIKHRPVAENNFQQLKAQYLSQLKHQLHQIAQELIEEQTGGNLRHQLAHELSGLTEAYLENFRKNPNA